MPVDRIVINASPLICLFRSELHDLLPQLFTEINVPDAVWQEVTQGGHDDPASRGLEKAEWAIHLPPTEIDPVIQAWDLGAGETSVLGFARQHPEYPAAIDDAAARRCARSLNINTLGTGGILVLAKRRGLIDSLAEALEAVQESGLWLRNQLVELLLKHAGEK
ncbi:MAG: DUF3368 domain-containing protein [Thiotrichales bacterium]